MYRTVWKFVVRPEAVDDFVRHYSSDGTWASLFRGAAGYVGTELYRTGNDFVTIDTWADEASYRRFREDQRDAYEALDQKTEGLTIREEHIAET